MAEFDEYGFAHGAAGRSAGRVDGGVPHAREWDRYIEEWSDTGAVVRTRQLKRLVRGGVPGSFRGRLWPCLAGTAKLREQHPPRHYEDLLERAERGQAEQHEVHSAIDKDLRRTFPGHRMFATPDGLAALRRVLVAYSVHAPSVGYCQSLNFVVAMLLLFTDEEHAFWLLDTIVRKLLPENYYTADMCGCMADQACLRSLVTDRFREHLRRAKLLEADWEVVTCKWYLCIFVNCLPLTTTLRVWDVFFYEGEEALFRVSLAIFKLHLEASPGEVGNGSDADRGGGTHELASLQTFADSCASVDQLFRAAFSDPRCRVKSGLLTRLRRNLPGARHRDAHQAPAASCHVPTVAGGLSRGGQTGVQSPERGLGEGSRSMTLLHRWRFGAGQRNDKGRVCGKGSGHADVELQESALPGDLCREQLDDASPYEHLASEQSWYAEEADDVGVAGAGGGAGAKTKRNMVERRARQAHDVPGGCKAAQAGKTCAMIGPGRLDRGLSLHATCEEGAEHAPSYARGPTTAADAEASAHHESLNRTMYKAPSFFALLRDDSEPLDVAVVDGYLSVASSVGASAEASIDGSVPATAPGPETVGSAGDASTPAAVRLNKQANQTSGLFSAWRHRPECRNEAASPAGIAGQGFERDGLSGLSGREVGQQKESQQPAPGKGDAWSCDPTTRPWDSGISLKRGYFDHGGLPVHVHGHAEWTVPGTSRRAVGAKLVPGDAATGSTCSSASSSVESDASGASIEILREREVYESGALLPHASLHGRSSLIYPQGEPDPVQTELCREGGDEGAGAGEGEGAGQAKLRRGNNDVGHGTRTCSRRLLPRVVFSPEPVPPEMDPRRPPIEVGSWRPLGRCDVPCDADMAMAGCERAPLSGGKSASILAPVASGEKEGESFRENWRPNVPAAGSGRPDVGMTPAKDAVAVAANGALAPKPEALTTRAGEAACAGLLFSVSASSQRPLASQSSLRSSDDSPDAALLHAKFFESCIVIEEYLSLFALEI